MKNFSANGLKYPKRRLASGLALILSAALGDAVAASPLSSLELSELLLRAANASVLPVTNCNDDLKGGTLREAISNAKSGSDRIDLSKLQCSSVTLLNGQLEVEEQGLEIIGSPSGFTIDANHSDRAFYVNSHGPMSLTNIVVKGGRPKEQYSGGCIFSYDTVRLTNSYVYDCKVDAPPYFTARGGAIYVQQGYIGLYESKISRSSAYSLAHVRAEGGGIWAPQVRIRNSEISGNSAIAYQNPGFGGGVFIKDTGTGSGYSSALYSTIAGNTASFGGGISSEKFVNFRNSTISGNTANVGAAIYDLGEISIYNSTIAFNNVRAAVGTSVIYSRNGPLTMFSSIVASNRTENSSPAIDIASATPLTITGTHNIVTNTALAISRDTISQDPILGPLSDNGGPTPTHMPLGGSPAYAKGIDRSDKFPFDQRLFSRGSPGNVDIGSVQDTLFRDGFESDSVEGGNSSKATFQ